MEHPNRILFSSSTNKRSNDLTHKFTSVSCEIDSGSDKDIIR